ncbi:MAG: hypothetical protein HRU01_26165, partial [Myxococcales bacterium]|nr:hypothetical protein [Myxococcales bacterium]
MRFGIRSSAATRLVKGAAATAALVLSTAAPASANEAYAGDYTGSFSGGDSSGSLQFTVASSGDLNGTGIPSSTSCDFTEGISFNFDGSVDGADMGLLLAEWSQNRSIADINRDGTVDGADLGL